MFGQKPARVKIIEVGARDGFQNVQTFIPTADKLAVIDALVAAKVGALEISSFVSPKAIPQLADAREVCAAVLERYGDTIETNVLIPNLRGAQAAFEVGIREAAYVVSVSVSHNKANINRTHEESLVELARVQDALPAMGLKASLATSFACPFEGWTRPEDVAAMIEKVQEMGIRRVVLCDTIGVATPERVYALAQEMIASFPQIEFSLHLHDTRGMGLANTMAGISAGIRTFETSIGGLGGCPFAPGAAGNTATEDVVNMLGGMGIETGIDLKALVAVTEVVASKVDAKMNSHMALAKLYENMDCNNK